MTAHIFNRDNLCISEGKNLAIIFRYAPKCLGVARITINKLDGKDRPAALVNVFYHNGFRACINFSCYSNAKTWAWQKSKRKGTWWTGCIVDHNLFD